MFESLRLYCSLNLSNVPLTFMLGFYVSLIVKRWWTQYNLLPWPDSFSILMTGWQRADLVRVRCNDSHFMFQVCTPLRRRGR